MVFSNAKTDGLVKNSPRPSLARTRGSPAAAGLISLDSCFFGNDGNGSVISYEFVKIIPYKKEELGQKKSLFRVKV